VEGAGIVAAVGEGVDEVAVGDRVAWVAAPGSYAERVVLDAARAVPVPEGVSSEVAASGPVAPVDPLRLQAGGSLYLTRPSLQHYAATREELLQRATDVFGWIASGELQVGIGGRYRLEDARRAQEDLQARRTTAKLVLLAEL
jgi:NADPH:quinone reductase